MVNLNVNIGDLNLKNPVMTASGTFGYGFEYADLIDIDRLGAFVVKGTTLEPRQGNPYPRMAETPSGMLNAVGLQNPGIDHFINLTYPKLIEAFDTEIIVNISGKSVDDYAEVARRLNALDRIHAVEVNISCPNVKAGGMAFGTTTQGVETVTSAVRNAFDRTVIIKISPNVTSIADMARAAEASGADAVSLINTLLGMAVDVESRRPRLSTVTGGLSGPAIRPVAVRMVWQAAHAVRIPVVGLGGITCGADALEFILAGATAVQVGTYNFVNPHTATDIIEYLEDYCERNHVADICDLIGALEV